MRTLRSVVILSLVAMGLAAIPSGAGARSQYCGNYGEATKIYALNVTCRTAYHVIRNFVCERTPVVRGWKTRTAPLSVRGRESFSLFCSRGRSGTYRCTNYLRLGGHPRVWTCRKHSFVVSWAP
jgi:hypothetical protein